MKTGNHVADIPDDDPYFDEQPPKKVQCNFCYEFVDDVYINYDKWNGRRSGIVYCDDCKPLYDEWKKENNVDEPDPLKNYETFINSL